MKDMDKTKKQLIHELVEMRGHIAALEKRKCKSVVKRGHGEVTKQREDLVRLVDNKTSELIRVIKLLHEEIDNRRHTEKKLKESEMRYRELIDNMSSGVAVYKIAGDGEDFIFQDMNKSGEKISSIIKNEIIGKSVREVFPGIEKFGLFKVLQKVWKTGKSAHHPISLYKDKRVSHWVENYVYKLPSGEIIAVYDDMTERKKAEEEAMRSSQLATLGELAAGVAHEINNPANGIINYAQILLNKSDEGSREYNIAGRIIDEGDRIATIVKCLLLFASDREEKKHPVHIQDILSDSLTLTEAQLKNDGIKLRIKVPPALPEINVRPQQIEHIFLNIMSNARNALNRKYSRRHDNKILEIQGRKIMAGKKPYIRIIFYDRGTGMPVELKDKITESFFSSTYGSKGTGLGLSISKNIIINYGGKMAIDSVEGKYTKVIIDLPVSKR